MPTVKLYANLRKLAGTKELSVPGVTVASVLGELANQAPGLRNVVLDGETLRPHVVITLNGHNIIDVNTQVTEDDVIAVFPPIAGGAQASEIGEKHGWLV
jgi:MoaD family protein